MSRLIKILHIDPDYRITYFIVTGHPSEPRFPRRRLLSS
jgi:hypothetical protein